MLNYELCIIHTHSWSLSVFFLLSRFYLLNEFYVAQQQEARKQQNQWHVALDKQVTIWSTKLIKYKTNTSFYVKMGKTYNRFVNIK